MDQIQKIIKEKEVDSVFSGEETQFFSVKIIALRKEKRDE